MFQSVINRRDFLVRSAAIAAGAVLFGSAHRPLCGQTAPAHEPIRSRKIPSTGEAIPAVGMGTWQTFDPNSIDDASLAPLEAVLKLFYDTGGRVVDTSPMYGRAEEITGILSDRLKINDELFFATKVWAGGKENGITQMNRSLHRLKRERLELMQIHNLADWQTQLETIRAWKAEGKFRYIGVTHHQVNRFDELENILRTEKVDFVQLPYSVAMREAENRLLPAAHDTHTAVLVMRPFEGGNLFGKTRGQPLPDFVKPWASSWAEAFLKFILANETVTCVIPATSKVEHLRDNMRAGAGALPDDEQRERLVGLLS